MSAQTFQLEPLVLQGPRLALEPLVASHLDGLERLFDAAIWRWYSVQLASREELRAFLEDRLREQAAGRCLNFAVREKARGELVGATSYHHIDRANRRVEIGSTWYAPAWQRTFVNTEAKQLLLSHAFEKLGCIAVELRTDALNERSRRAIERLGANQDGILRSHRICRDGRIRDSVVYSIVAEEWPGVRARLMGLMSAEK